MAPLKNLLRSLAVLLVVSFVTFSLMFGNGTGIAQAVLGCRPQRRTCRRKVVKLGLDRPLLVQYGDWLKGAVAGRPRRSRSSPDRR